MTVSQYDPNDTDENYLKDIIGYDGEFNQKTRAWCKKFLSQISYEGTHQSFMAFISYFSTLSALDQRIGFSGMKINRLMRSKKL